MTIRALKIEKISVRGLVGDIPKLGHIHSLHGSTMVNKFARAFARSLLPEVAVKLLPRGS